MFSFLFFLFTILPLAELYLLFKIGGVIGTGNTFLIIFLTGILGAFFVRNQGLITLHNIQRDMGQGKVPTKQLMHGFLIFGGGLLLLTPGFLTDILGMLFILPLSRHLIAKLAENAFAKGMKSGHIHVKTYHYQQHHHPENFQQEKLDGNTIEADFQVKE